MKAAYIYPECGLIQWVHGLDGGQGGGAQCLFILGLWKSKSLPREFQS